MGEGREHIEKETLEGQGKRLEGKERPGVGELLYTAYHGAVGSSLCQEEMYEPNLTKNKTLVRGME